MGIKKYKPKQMPRLLERQIEERNAVSERLVESAEKLVADSRQLVGEAKKRVQRSEERARERESRKGA